LALEAGEGPEDQVAVHLLEVVVQEDPTLVSYE